MINGLFLSAVAFAQQAPTQTPGPGGAPSPFGNMFFMIAMLVILFYFLILRPQKAEQRKREEMLNALSKGDAVVTSGGILGTVESVDGSKGIVTLNVAPKVSLRVSRAAITQITRKKDVKPNGDESAADKGEPK